MREYLMPIWWLFGPTLVCATLLSSTARAQSASTPDEVLSRIPAERFATSPERQESRTAFACEGADYLVDLAVRSVEGSPWRQAAMDRVSTPAGDLSPTDTARINESLSRFHAVTGVEPACWGRDVALQFSGRQRGDGADLSFVAWISSGRLVRISE